MKYEILDVRRIEDLTLRSEAIEARAAEQDRKLDACIAEIASLHARVEELERKLVARRGAGGFTPAV